MNLLRKVLLGMALVMVATGAMVIAPTTAQAAIVEAHPAKFATQAAAEAFRVMWRPSTVWGPTFVKYLQFGSYGPGYYVVNNVGS